MNSEFEIDQEIYSAARKGLKLLSDSERNEIKNFVESQISEEGCFLNSKGEPDLYITACGILLAGLLGIDKNVEATTAYLRSAENGEGLDYIYVVSLTRAWRFYQHDSLEIGSYNKIAEHLEYNRCKDKLWNQANGTHFGSVYGTYLAISAYQNLGLSVPDEGKLKDPLLVLRSKDGAYGTDRGADSGTTPSTAFAILISNFIEEDCDFAISWLLKQQHSDGGFVAVSQMPFSDVQSTAYAVMALKAAAPEKLSGISEDVQKYVASMKVNGGYRGHLKEESAGVENTLLALATLGFTS